MGKAYDTEFRLRVLAALDRGQSKMSVHRTLGVSRSTIDDWVALREQTGAVMPQVRRASRRRAIADEAAFEAFALRQSGATLGQMAAAWHEETGCALTPMTFSRMLRRIGWTRKKRAFSTPSATPTSAPSSSGN